MSEIAQQYALVAFGDRIEISVSEYQSLLEATTKLLDALMFEEKLDVLLGNHLELESDLLSISVRDALLSDELEDKFHSNRALLNRRLINLLGSCTAYRDCAKSTVGSLLPERPDEFEFLESTLHSHYDDNLGFRVMEAMRNFVSHRGFPVHKVNYSSEIHETESRNRFSHNISFFASTTHLREGGKFKAAVLKELEVSGKDVDLKPLLRDYVQCLLSVHTELRTKFHDVITQWEVTVSGAIQRFSGTFPLNQAVGLLCCATYRGEKLQSEFHVNTIVMERRKVLSQRNRGFANYGKRFVTNAVNVKNEKR